MLVWWGLRILPRHFDIKILSKIGSLLGWKHGIKFETSHSCINLYTMLSNNFSNLSLFFYWFTVHPQNNVDQDLLYWLRIKEKYCNSKNQIYLYRWIACIKIAHTKENSMWREKVFGKQKIFELVETRRTISGSWKERHDFRSWRNNDKRYEIV